MSKLEKTLSKWKARPTLVEKEEVLNVLSRYGFCVEFRRGSHIFVSHPDLVGQAGFGQFGEFTLPVKNGRKVKGVYLKQILHAIDIVHREKSDEQES